MKLLEPKALYLKAYPDGTCALVYEWWLELTESEMVPLGNDIVKATKNINAMLKQRASLLQQLREKDSQIAELQLAAQTGIVTDAETDEALNAFHDLIGTLPDDPPEALEPPSEPAPTPSAGLKPVPVDPETPAAPKPPAGSDPGPHEIDLK